MVMDGAVTMMVIGAVLMLVRDFITSAIQTVLGYVFVSVEVSDQDSSEVYRWTESWISQQPFAKAFNTMRATMDDIAVSPSTTRKVLAAQEVNLVPGRGMHMFWLDRLLIWCAIVCNSSKFCIKYLLYLSYLLYVSFCTFPFALFLLSIVSTPYILLTVLRVVSRLTAR